MSGLRCSRCKRPVGGWTDWDHELCGFCVKMENEIKRVQNLMNKPDELTEAERDEINTMVLRFAKHLRSPSKLNAVSVLKSNSAEKLAAWLSQEEGVDAC